MIEIRDLEKRLSPEFSLHIPSLTIGDGERVALIGPNGAGKSTLLRLLAGLLKPDAGSITVTGGQDAVAYQPQTPYVFKGTAEANVRLGARGKVDIEQLLKDCQLDGLRKKKTDKLSGGERQRLCLARVLAGGSRVLLLDEPLSAADIETGEALCHVLRDHCAANGVTLVMSTHLPRQAFEIATKFLILHRGEIAEYGDAAALNDPQSALGKRFLSQWKLV